MNEDLHNIDDLFRKGLENHADEASSSVWDAIDKAIDKHTVVATSRRYKKLKWAAVLLLLFSVSMATYIFYIKKQNAELAGQINAGGSSKKEASSINPPTGTNNALTNGINNKTNVRATPLQSTDITSNSRKLPAHRRDSGRHHAANNVAQGRHVSPKTFENTTGKSGAEENNPTKNTAFTINKHQLAAKTLNATASVITAGNKKARHSRLKQANGRLGMEVMAPETDEDKARQSLQKNIDLAALPGLHATSLIAGPSALHPDKASILLHQDNAGKKAIAGTNFSKTNSGKKLSLTAFFSPDIVSSEVENDHPRFREEEKDEIEKHESMEFSSTIGLLLNYSLGKKWLIESGITYSTSKTDIEPKKIYARPDDAGNIKYQFNSSAGYTYVQVANATPASGDSINTLLSGNTLHYIGIPVSIRYVFGANRWNIIPSIGTSINFLTKGNMNVAVPSANGSEVKTQQKIQGLKSTYISGMGGVALQYHVNKLFALSFEPKARFSLGSVNDETPIKTSLRSLGFVIGLVIKL